MVGRVNVVFEMSTEEFSDSLCRRTMPCFCVHKETSVKRGTFILRTAFTISVGGASANKKDYFCHRTI